MPPRPTISTKSKRRKSRYKTGVHHSPKCKTPINYRSGWEFVICLWLDGNPDVVEYAYEAIEIPYISNIRTKKVRRYYPDFLVTYSDGRRILAEVKRAKQTENILVKKKAEAARKWVKENQATYEFWSEPMILPLLKAYQALLPLSKKKTRRKKQARKQSKTK